MAGGRKVDKAAFARRFVERRDRRGLSQAELAELAGMAQQGIDNIEQGKVKRPRLLRELAEILETTEDWLLWEEGPADLPSLDRELKELADLWKRANPRQRSIVRNYLLGGKKQKSA